MDESKKTYETPKAVKLEFDYVNTVVASIPIEEIIGKNKNKCGSGTDDGEGKKNPAQCTTKNPGHCDLGQEPGHGCSNEGNPGNESTGGERKQPFKCVD